MPWTDVDQRKFAAMLFAMGELYETPVSTARGELFLRAIEDLPYVDVERAAAIYMRNGKFFPKPADLRELIEGNVEDHAEEAWVELRKMVSHYGYLGTPEWGDDFAMKRAALDLFGGWRALCENLPVGGPELLGYAKQFKASYLAHARAATYQHAALPPSSRPEATALLQQRMREIDAHRSSHGEDTHVPQTEATKAGAARAPADRPGAAGAGAGARRGDGARGDRGGRRSR